ncbi:hypothetical protein ACJIZ3_007576 [Penstemon smallii]|uniref:RING-type domain-containing protein n=1 Tax=Penstemon smallii TaxID=265156 RepID=A0ABD3T8E3_9LAMI
MSSCGSCHVPMCSTQSAWTHGLLTSRTCPLCRSAVPDEDEG